MRYATFSLLSGPSSPRLGVVHGDGIVDFAAAVAGRWHGDPPATLLGLIQLGPDAWSRARELAGGDARSHAARDVRWHAPIPRPLKNVFCVGRNYAAHVREGAAAHQQEAKLPEIPVFFTKAPTTVNGPFDDVPRHRGVTEQMDWEVELGVIIGRAGRNIARSDALAHVFGYTVINDITARDLQQRHTQWFKGKSLDGSCPMGPYVVTADEFGDPHAKDIALRVNGVVKQHGNTRDMIFPIDALIASLSHGLTLEAGDIIATGTPDGVGFARTPPEFLHDGDIMETDVEGIGTMRNRIVAQA